MKYGYPVVRVIEVQHPDRKLRGGFGNIFREVRQFSPKILRILDRLFAARGFDNRDRVDVFHKARLRKSYWFIKFTCESLLDP